MVIFMKISNTNTLGNKLMARNNERRMVKATGERFEMSKKDIINNGVNAKIVKDKMGMLMASQALGDEIASTIRTGMNICAINFAQFIGEDGTLGENAVHVALMYSGLYWKVWDRQTKTVNFEKAEKIVESRAGAKLEPIYNKDDVMLAENKYNMKRYIYGVNDFYLRRAEMALNAINANTTLEELERFQREFVFLTRGLGEQTIDVTKHINYVFYTTMKRLISPYITVVGGIKELESNIGTYRRSKDDYTINVKADPNRKVDYKEDTIGIFKQAAVDTMEDSMRGFIDLLEKECNYNSYKQYDSIDLTEKNNFLLATVIGEAQDNVMDMDNDTRERCLAGIYNMAAALKINQSDVFKIAMKLAISEVKIRKGEVYIIPAIGSEH